MHETGRGIGSEDCGPGVWCRTPCKTPLLFSGITGQMVRHPPRLTVHPAVSIPDHRGGRASDRLASFFAPPLEHFPGFTVSQGKHAVWRCHCCFTLFRECPDVGTWAQAEQALQPVEAVAPKAPHIFSQNCVLESQLTRLGSWAAACQRGLFGPLPSLRPPVHSCACVQLTVQQPCPLCGLPSTVNSCLTVFCNLSHQAGIV